MFEIEKYDSLLFDTKNHKNTKVALIQPHIPDGNYLPNLGIMYLAAILLKDGFEIKIFDENIDVDINEMLFDYQPEIIGITCVTAAINRCASLALKWKEELDCKIIIGGPHVSVLPVESLTKYDEFDFAVFDEAEKIFSALCHEIKKKSTDYSLIPNLVWRKNNKVIKNITSKYLSNNELDELPFPAWHLIEIEKVFSNATHGLFSKGKRIMPIMTTRGCPHYCGFCSRVMGFQFRQRSINNIIEEIKWLYESYNIDEIYFEDDTFTQDMSRAFELLDAIINLKLPIYVKFANGLRADKVDRALLLKMREANVYWVGFGIESGSEHTQEIMLKNLDLELVKDNVLLAKELGFKVGSNCIIGYPGETKDDVKVSLNFFSSLDLDSFAVVTCVPFPGTTAWKICKENDWFTEKANDYSNYWFEIFKITPLIETPHISAKELERIIFFAYIRFYLFSARRLTTVIKVIFKQKITSITDKVRFLRSSILSTSLGSSTK